MSVLKIDGLYSISILMSGSTVPKIRVILDDRNFVGTSDFTVLSEIKVYIGDKNVINIIVKSVAKKTISISQNGTLLAFSSICESIVYVINLCNGSYKKYDLRCMHKNLYTNLPSVNDIYHNSIDPKIGADLYCDKLLSLLDNKKPVVYNLSKVSNLSCLDCDDFVITSAFDNNCLHIITYRGLHTVDLGDTMNSYYYPLQYISSRSLDYEMPGGYLKFSKSYSTYYCDLHSGIHSIWIRMSTTSDYERVGKDRIVFVENIPFIICKRRTRNVINRVGVTLSTSDDTMHSRIDN
jgi:hypothetical protein